MKSARKFAAVLVTAPNLKTAQQLARSALEAGLVACANIVPVLESHYWWQGKIERSTEVLVLFKTAKACLPALEKLILALHPYDTPEFITLLFASGTPRYLAWIEASVLKPRRTETKRVNRRS